MELATVNRFRSRRGRYLRLLVERTAKALGRDISVLDVGGRPEYWSNIGFSRIGKIDLLSNDERELARDFPPGAPEGVFSLRLGDACDLSAYEDQSIDLVHSNSVIEHVGGWNAMVAMANEVQRVGLAGWIQTPAWEFPLEPHFRLPFMHWLARPIQARVVYYSAPWRGYRNDLHIRRQRIERINLLSRTETCALFPGKQIYVERVMGLPKSYCVYWSPIKCTEKQHRSMVAHEKSDC